MISTTIRKLSTKCSYLVTALEQPSRLGSMLWLETPGVRWTSLLKIAGIPLTLCFSRLQMDPGQANCGISPVQKLTKIPQISSNQLLLAILKLFPAMNAAGQSAIHITQPHLSGVNCSRNPQFCAQKRCYEFRCHPPTTSKCAVDKFPTYPNILVSTNPRQWAAINVSHRRWLRPVSTVSSHSWREHVQRLWTFAKNDQVNVFIS